MPVITAFVPLDAMQVLQMRGYVGFSRAFKRTPVEAASFVIDWSSLREL